MAPHTEPFETRLQRRTERRPASQSGSAQPKLGSPVRQPGDPEEPWEVLPYHVELWDLQRQSVERVLGDAISAVLARAIFQSALREYPNRHITLRYGATILARSGDLVPPHLE